MQREMFRDGNRDDRDREMCMGIYTCIERERILWKQMEHIQISKHYVVYLKLIECCMLIIPQFKKGKWKIKKKIWMGQNLKLG